MIYWRLIVELCERLRAGSFRAAGRRIDVVRGSPTVALALWANPDMTLLPSGEFRCEPRSGHPPPGAGLPLFIELTLSPATAVAKKSEQKQKRATHRQRLKDALLALNEAGVDISSRLIRVDDLHKMAEEKAGSKRHSSKQTFERALKEARDSLSED
jgi:predicted DNA-binding protein (UPF0251 family)